MRLSHTLFAVAALAAIVATGQSAAIAQPTPAPAALFYDDQPGRFVENRGQWPGTVHYRLRGARATAWFLRDGWILDLTGDDPWRGASVRFTFEERDATAPPAGEQAPTEPPQGDDARSYARLRYAMGNGVDVVLRVVDGALAFELDCLPAVPRMPVSVRVDGIRGLAITRTGALQIETPVGPIANPAPHAWQRVGEERRALACHYERTAWNRFGLFVGDRVDAP